MAYAFIDIETIPSLDENNNPVNLGTATIPDNTDVVIFRPDAAVDLLTLTFPENPTDGQIVRLSTLEACWSIAVEGPENSGTTFWFVGESLTLTTGAMITVMYVDAENKWYVLQA